MDCLVRARSRLRLGFRLREGVVGPVVAFQTLCCRPVPDQDETWPYHMLGMLDAKSLFCRADENQCVPIFDFISATKAFGAVVEARCSDFKAIEQLTESYRSELILENQPSSGYLNNEQYPRNRQQPPPRKPRFRFQISRHRSLKGLSKARHHFKHGLIFIRFALLRPRRRLEGDRSTFA